MEKFIAIKNGAVSEPALKIATAAVSAAFVLAAFGIVYRIAPLPVLWTAAAVHAVFSFYLYRSGCWRSLKDVPMFVMRFSVCGVIALMGIKFAQYGDTKVVSCIVIAYCFIFMWFFFRDQPG